MSVEDFRKQRCPALDDDGCRCLLRPAHRGPHDFSYTPWTTVLARSAGKPWSGTEWRPPTEAA